MSIVVGDKHAKKMTETIAKAVHGDKAIIAHDNMNIIFYYSSGVRVQIDAHRLIELLHEAFPDAMLEYKTDKRANIAIEDNTTKDATHIILDPTKTGKDMKKELKQIKKDLKGK